MRNIKNGKMILSAAAVIAITVAATITDAQGAAGNKSTYEQKIEKIMVDKTTMGRLGEVEDIAACALYLASPAASYVTGEIYGVNGGLTTLNFEMPRADL